MGKLLLLGAVGGASLLIASQAQAYQSGPIATPQAAAAQDQTQDEPVGLAEIVVTPSAAAKTCNARPPSGSSHARCAGAPNRPRPSVTGSARLRANLGVQEFNTR